MSEIERRIADSLATAIPQLPEEKKEYLLGFAEGVAAMTKPRNEPPSTTTPQN